MASKTHQQIRERIFYKMQDITGAFCLRDIFAPHGWSPTEGEIAKQLIRDLIKSGDLQMIEGQKKWYRWIN